MQVTEPNTEYFPSAGKVPENGRQTAGDPAQNFCGETLLRRLA